ncbi:MAG: nucleoside deaminase [Sphingobacteriaceae bacterium]|nr:nucleoside deaminase [Sphingobacteriaceae bacterium]
MDAFYLQRAIELSAKSLNEAPGGPFGAVIVMDGEIIAEGWNEVTSTFDPTAHAEMQAIRKATQKSRQFHLTGAVIYSSCEPCPMCLSAIYWAKIDRVVYANTRQQAEEIGFGDAFIYEQVSLPAEKRHIPCVHLHSEEASAIFSAWKWKDTKILY